MPTARTKEISTRERVLRTYQYVFHVKLTAQQEPDPAHAIQLWLHTELLQVLEQLPVLCAGNATRETILEKTDASGANGLSVVHRISLSVNEMQQG